MATWDRATICVSSQVGCAVNCQFCLTAKLGLQRNLTAGEIAGQVVAVLDRHGVEVGKDRAEPGVHGHGRAAARTTTTSWARSGCWSRKLA